MRHLKFIAALGIALFGFTSASVIADTYPGRTVTIVVPYPAGGSVDGVARIIAQKLNETLGQQLYRRKPGRRRRRHRRRELRRQGGARRLHLDADGLDPCGDAVPAQDRPLRCGHGFHADHAGGVRTAGRQHDTGRAGQDAEGILRSRAQGPEQIHLRDLELRVGRPPRDRTAQARCRRRDAGDRLQGREPGLDRLDERPGAVDGRSDAVLAAAGESRKHQGPGHYQHQARRRARPKFPPSPNPA